MNVSVAAILTAALMASVVPGSIARAGNPSQPPPSLPPPSMQALGHVPGEVIVRYRDEAVPSERKLARSAASAISFRRGPVPGSQVLRVDGSVGAAVRSLEARSDVLYAEPNHLWQALATPNDPFYGNQWALGTGGGSISAPRAWDITTGGGAPTLAVVDSGMQMDHPDLAGSLWTNPGEVAGNGVDDDGNGYVDDVNGWDWVESDPLPQDQHGHGTHVAGIAGARGNDGYGVAGLAWGPKIMVLRALNENGVGTTSNIGKAFSYAAAKGARIVNASLGGTQPSNTLAEAITNAPGTLFVTAAGNGGSDGIGDDNDLIGSYPCNVAAPNLLCVAASTPNDELATFSNYGSTTVHLAAPGTSILSTLTGSRHGYASGTSMATPFVAGAAALLWSYSPGATVAQVKNAILEGVDKIPSMDGKLISGGRLNAYSPLLALGATPPQEPEPEPTDSPSPSPSPSPDDPLEPLPLDPLPTDSEPSPSPSPSPSPTEEPTNSDEPPAAAPEPAPDEPETFTLGVRKQKHRYRARGTVEPALDQGKVRVVLLRKRNGRFRKVARRDVSLWLSGDETRSIYKAFFRKRKGGRCRIKARLFTADGATDLVRKRTFRC